MQNLKLSRVSNIPLYIEWLREKTFGLFFIFCLFLITHNSLLITPCCYAQDVKYPNVAGAFYPANPAQLSQQIDGFLEKAGPQEATKEDILVLISPHAGYEYSGPVAAYGYRAVKDKHYDVVVIIAPTHNLAFDGIAIWPKGFFKTPLGNVPVDEEISLKLMQLNPDIKSIPEAFLGEHSLEVQLPFLQKVLKDFKIIPLIMGRFDLTTCEVLAHALSLIKKDREILLVASTDLSHYHPYDDANKIDKLTISYIENLNPKGLYAQAQAGNAEACGLGGVLSSLLYANELGLKSKVLKYANSGDITSDYSKVVGYVSAAMYKPAEAYQKEAKKEEEGEKIMLTQKQKERLLQIARQSIETYLKTGKMLEVTETDPLFNSQYGAFVTLHEKGELRGCIGNMVGHGPLYLTVRDMAVESAFRDPRFGPLKASELKDIEIEISVLSPLKKAESVDEIQLGVHGVLVQRGFNSGVFLPQVATETKWTKEEFLSYLCLHKAGLPADAWKDKGTDLYIFTAEVFSEK